MRNALLLSFFWILLCTPLFSQDYVVSGTVRDAAGTPLALASVFLLDEKYTTLIDGTSTNEAGQYEITGIPPGNYYLKASYIENESDPIPIAIKADLVLDDILLNKTKELKEVVVLSEKPRLERKIDRLVFTVENTSIADADVWEVLKRTPSVVVVNDKITIKGAGNVGIMINERLVNLPQGDIINLLSGTSASNVEAIEVITNPPAKYSAEGGMLINIKMKTNLISGYNGAVYNRYKQAVLPKHLVGTDHFFKGKKAAFSVNYSFNNNNQVDRYTDNTNFFEGSDLSSLWVLEQTFYRYSIRHNLNTFFDYIFDDKNKLSFSTITSIQPKLDKQVDSETRINDSSGVLENSFTTQNISKQDQLNTSYYLDYIHSFTKKEAKLSVGSHYTYYDYDRFQVLQTDFFDFDRNLIGENDFNTINLQRVDLYNAQLDFQTTLGVSGNFETGLRYAGIDSKSDVEQEGFDRSQPGIDPTENGDFDYEEDIYAAYLAYGTKWGSWTMKSGLRAEFTETQGVLEDSAPRNNDYLEWFPSFSFSYAPNKKNNLVLNYYRRINRPRYNKVNPFQVFLSNNVVEEGNPGLLPATRNYVALDYTYNQTYTVEFYYRNEKNPFRILLFQDNDSNLIRFISTSLDQRISYGTELSYDKRIMPFWSIYANLHSYYNEYRFEDLESNAQIENGRWTWLFRNTHSFKFLRDKTLSADLSFMYRSPRTLGNEVQSAISNLGVSMRKTFWEGKVSISMRLDDIFNQSNAFLTREFEQQLSTTDVRLETRMFSFNLRYRFGNEKIKNNKKSKRVEERNRI